MASRDWVGSAVLGVVLALAGCLEPSAPPDDGGDGEPSGESPGLQFESITADGSWAFFEHLEGDCLVLADHDWMVTGGDGVERETPPLVWEDEIGPRPGASRQWCPGEERVFGLEGTGLARLRIADGDGRTVAIVPGPGPFDIAFAKDETQGRAAVVTSSPEADWNRLGIKADQPGTTVRAIGSDEEAEVAVDGEFRRLTEGTDDIGEGDFLQLCATDGAVDLVMYTVADLWSNTILYVVTFQQVAPCQ